MSAPYYADYINAAQNSNPTPTTVHYNSVLFRYYQRHLLHRAASVFRWSGVPETWDMGLLNYCIFAEGHAAIIATSPWGVIPQPCGLSGIGIQYQPTTALIANPLLQQPLQPTIGIDCAVLRIMPDWCGIMDVVNHHAALMAQAVELYAVNSGNSQLSYVFGTENKRAAETWKKVYDRIRSGEGAVFTDADLFDDNGRPRWQMFLQDIRNNYIGTECLEALRKIECMFDNAVGIPNNMATAKKERTISAEVEANDVETQTSADQWLDELRRGLRDVKRLFGLDITIDWRYPHGANTNSAGVRQP